ncbi:MAG: hypothetical protein HY959_14375 [Ignavibacteriae bacterium]|nr:hypothetical protein [Ignavibacteriota bacterium]
MSLKRNLYLIPVSALLILISFSCTAVMDNIINDSRFEDGDYLFVMYGSHESSISVYGTMSIYYMSGDSTVTGSYSAELNKNFTLPGDKGGIIGKANWSQGDAKIRFGSSTFSSVEITLRKNIDIVEGEWSSGYRSGKIYAFKKTR